MLAMPAYQGQSVPDPVVRGYWNSNSRVPRGCNIQILLDRLLDILEGSTVFSYTMVLAVFGTRSQVVPTSWATNQALHA